MISLTMLIVIFYYYGDAQPCFWEVGSFFSIYNEQLGSGI